MTNDSIDAKTTQAAVKAATEATEKYVTSQAFRKQTEDVAAQAAVKAATEATEKYVTRPEFHKQTEDVAAKATSTEVQKYVSSEEFREKIESSYMREFRKLVERFEKRARLWTYFGAAFFIVIFATGLWWMYAEAKEKKADVVIQYAEALATVSNLKITVREFEDEIARSIKKLQDSVDSGTKLVEDQLESLNSRVKEMEKRVGEIKTELSMFEKPPN